jgi:hypothetical protein
MARGKARKDHEGPGVKRSRGRIFLFPGACKTYANLWEGKNLLIQSPVSNEWRDMGHSWAEVRVFSVSLGQAVNNLHTFAIEKKVQRKRSMLNLKYSIKSYMFSESQNFPILAASTSL